MNARPRTAVVTAVSVSALVFLSACSSSGSSSASKSSSSGAAAADVTIGAVIHALDNPFFVTMKQGMDEAGAEFGARVTVEAPPSLGNASAQVDLLNAMADKGYDCVVVDPLAATTLNQSIATISKAGTPVINLDTPVDSSDLTSAGGTITSFIGSNNKSAGEQGAAALVKAIASTPSIGLIAGPPNTITSADRIGGAQVGAAGATFAGPVHADWDTQKAYAAARAMLAENADINGIFSANDQMALGVATAVEESGRDVAIMGVDGIQEMLTDIKDMKTFGTVSQYPYAMGRMGVEACIAAVQGRAVPANVESPIVLITHDNVDKAIADFPRPPVPYDDPFAALVTK